MLQTQVDVLVLLGRIRSAVGDRLGDDRGEVTSTVAIIAVLVIGALAAGAIVVARIMAHAEAIPDPTAGG